MIPHSRFDDPTRVLCLDSDCGWTGRVADMVHTYAPTLGGDVEPVDYCPKCGSEMVKEVALDGTEKGNYDQEV